MSDYDSILKEKKKYQDNNDIKIVKKKHFPYLLLDTICIGLIIIISYFIYYNNVLAPDVIAFSDINTIVDDYKRMFNFLDINTFNSDFSFNGEIDLNGEKNYDYNIYYQDRKFQFKLSTLDEYLLYSVDSKNKYLKLSNFNDYYILLGNYKEIINLNDIKDKFVKSIDKNKYIKRFYFENYMPIVEVNLTLNNDELSRIINNYKGNYNVLFTFKNNALTNEIVGIKVSITDLNNNKRYLGTYSNGKIIISDGDKLNLKLGLSFKGEDFTLKIYKDNVLYGVGSGVKSEDSYLYTYQIIDRVYNIMIDISRIDDGYLFNGKSNIDKNIKNFNVTYKKNNSIIDVIDTSDSIKNINTFTSDEKRTYEEALDNMLSYLREFINEYK